MYLRCSQKGKSMNEALELEEKIDYKEWQEMRPEGRPVMQIGYWRKANHVLNWINENVAQVENCQDVQMSAMQIRQLRDTCQEVLNDKNKAKRLMPTTEGFFFGSQDYKEWYFEDLEETVRICNRALAEVDFNEQDVWFHAWW